MKAQRHPFTAQGTYRDTDNGQQRKDQHSMVRNIRHDHKVAKRIVKRHTADGANSHHRSTNERMARSCMQGVTLRLNQLPLAAASSIGGLGVQQGPQPPETGLAGGCAAPRPQSQLLRQHTRILLK